MEILQEENGKYSSKRAMGVLYMIVGLAMAIIDQVTSKDATFEILLTVIGTGAGLLGLSIFKYFGKGKNIESPTK